MNVALISRYDYIPFKEYDSKRVKEKEQKNIEIELFKNELEKYFPVNLQDSFRIKKKNFYDSIRYIAKQEIFDRRKADEGRIRGYYRKKIIERIKELKRGVNRNLIDIIV